MPQRRRASTSGVPQAQASAVIRRVRSIVSTAESEAEAIRREAHEAAERQRRESEAWAMSYLDEKKLEADEAVGGRLSQLSGSIDGIIARLDRIDAIAKRLERQLNGVGRGSRRARGGQPAPAPAHPLDEALASELANVSGDGKDSPVGRREKKRRRKWSKRQPDEIEALAPEPSGHRAARDRKALIEEDGDLEGPRMVAMQLSNAGYTRLEVLQHLRETYPLVFVDLKPILDEVFGEEPSAQGKRVSR